MTELETWEPAKVKAAMDAGEIVLIDVRSPAEYLMEHIPGALLFPMAFFDARALPAQEGKRIVLHCGSGMRSDKVAQMALAAGVGKMAHMGGGIAGWKKAGLPYMTTDVASGAPKRMP